ncbi:indolepyruvate ferredoxin oxidoreductase subunit alpha [Heliobacillus mobilis]|uniref:Indolepyruvate oxidoreductase subunit IorA n=1 Tax=Heliobacterium mobile TaxID=28064 RepID=A0A6I3SIU5_HELMO|nr:indolepyruvate ferredoxin oxidoreductase subunit alpha [Heliobacterium mobile]MTV48682.1 indolepyruvate ferredoxin oxidoreductase subunit alpha [Heliobacterium mobile]
MSLTTETPSPRQLLMGNEAIAWGAIEAGVRVVAAYPGTPSTEVTEHIIQHAADYGIYAEWSVNEKVALETAIAASWAGARAMACMKQVGLNVASDPLMTLAYLGTKGGLVLVVADDPGPHSSQTEQDTRLFARFAKLPVLDPSTPAEAREMTKLAFELSESLKVPVILRPTTRTAHVCQDVEFSPPPRPAVPLPPLHFERDPNWAILPTLSAKKHRWLNACQKDMGRWFVEKKLNRVVPECSDADTVSVGIVTGGVSYNYVQEALANLGVSLPVYKVGGPTPLPAEDVLDYLQGKHAVFIVEEQEPVIEEQLTVAAFHRGIQIPIVGKLSGHLPREGEFNTNTVQAALRRYFAEVLPELSLPEVPTAQAGLTDIPAPPLRTPILCAGCPHRNSFYAFKKSLKGQDALFTGDIGCYTLGVMPPLRAADTIVCMGASVAMAAGFDRVEPARPHIAFLGDSTFFHSGIPPLINAVYNQARMTLVVLDNRTTAMTGHQPHPGLGWKGKQEPAPYIDIAAIAQACGVEWIRTVDPYDLPSMIAAAKEAVEYPGVSVIIARRDCISIAKRQIPHRIDDAACRRCGLCIRQFGCPALFEAPLTEEERQEGRKSGAVRIAREKCFGCGACAQVCPWDAISPEVQR